MYVLKFCLICIFPVSLLGRYFEREVSENWGHQKGDTYWSALWKLPWLVEPTSFLCLLCYLCFSSFNQMSNLIICSLVLQKRWPPTFAMWGGWTSLRSLTMTTWGSSSLIYLTGTAMSLTMNMTGLANHLWVPLSESTHPFPPSPSFPLKSLIWTIKCHNCRCCCSLCDYFWIRTDSWNSAVLNCLHDC